MTKRFIPDQIIPPGVRDKRQSAFVEALDTMFGEINLSTLIMSDPHKVDARLLPVLVVEYSCQEFIEPGLNDAVVRDLIARSFDLHAMKGTVAGTKLGLSLLGMRVGWKQWYQQQPKALHDTHIVTAYVNQQIFDGEQTYLNAKVQRQAIRMINATKRWSQDTAFQLGVSVAGSLHAASAGEAVQVARLSGSTNVMDRAKSTTGLASAGETIQVFSSPAGSKTPSRGLAGAAIATGSTAIQIGIFNGEALVQ